MMRILIMVLVLFVDLVFLPAWNAEAWKVATHGIISLSAAEHSVLGAEGVSFLYTLGFAEGLESNLKWGKEKKKIWKWISEGSSDEDAGLRFLNHFHNPLKDWAHANFDDFPVVTDIRPTEAMAIWAQDGTRQNGFQEGDWSWRKVRDYYRQALIATSKAQREELFAKTFRGLGFQLHLIQDASQPYHVRNDSHPDDEKGLTDSELQFTRVEQPLGSLLMEYWAQRNGPIIASAASQRVYPDLSLEYPAEVNALAPVPITQFIDSNEYTGSNPTASFTQGLAEYTNANFFSRKTIFAETKPSNDKHYFPYPRRSSTDIDKFLNETAYPKLVYGKDNLPVLGFWTEKKWDGETVEHFVKPTYHSRDIEADNALFEKTWHLDEQCHKDYVGKLMPRAAAYSAKFVDYFFRRTIEIIPASNGLYAFCNPNGPGADPNQAGFSKITLRARNISPYLSEEMSNGTLTLVVQFKVAQEDPFVPGDVEVSQDYTYIAAELPGSVDWIARPTYLDLSFDLPTNIPIHATDVYLHLVFKGVVGGDVEGVAVGFKDISEPTPFDVYNITDAACLAGEWKPAGCSTGGSDTNHNGIPDGNETEVVSHQIENLQLRFSSEGASLLPPPSDVVINSLGPGQSNRYYLLADKRFDVGYSDFELLPIAADAPCDHWIHLPATPGTKTFEAVIRQSERATGDTCASHGLASPCTVKYISEFIMFRGKYVHASLAIENRPLPFDSECPLKDLW